MKKVFELTNRYIILGTPLILFSLLSTIYLAVSARGAVINLIIGLALFALMASAFTAGWFNMVKIAVLEPERDDPNSLIKEFTPGVGEYFLSALGMLLNILLISLIILMIASVAGMKIIGNPNISVEALNSALQNPEALKTFLASLTKEQLIKINAWNFLLLASMALTYFLELLSVPALFFKNKNPFIAFFIGLKDLFSRKFFQTLGIFVLIFVVYSIISILSALFIGNTILHFLITLANFYFITSASVGVFYYYHNNFVKPQIGQNIDKRV